MTGRLHNTAAEPTPKPGHLLDKQDAWTSDNFRGRRNRRYDGSLQPRVAEAIAIAQTAAPHLAELAADIIPEMPFRVLASADVKSRRAWSIVEPICYAIERRYLSFNNGEFVNAIIIDIDHDDVDRWRMCGLPAPTWIAVTPESGRHHLVWWLASPVFKGSGSRIGPQRYLARVIDAMTYELDGDPGYSGVLTKNPFHPHWRVSTRGGAPVELDDLYAAVHCAPSAARQRRRGEARSGIGRNVELFDRLRFWAYDHKHTFIDRRAWGLAVAAQAAAINAEFTVPLARNEVGWVVKSVAEWVWDRYQRGSGANRVRRGAMGLADDMPLADKQVAAGVWSAAKRRASTDEKIAAAIAVLRGAGRALTQAAIADQADVSLLTVKRRWSTVKTMVASPTDDGTVADVAPTVMTGTKQKVIRPSALPKGGLVARSTARIRAEAYRAARLASVTAAIVSERQGGTGRPPIPAFLLAAERLRAVG